MTAASATITLGANLLPATSGGKSRNSLRANYLAMQKARSLFPHKTARHLSDMTGFPLRTVEYWLSRGRMPSEAVAALLQSEHGLEFLDAVMTDARPAWWVCVRRALAMDGRRRARKNLQEAIDARDEIEAAIVRATNALSISDPDFARPHLDALGDVARVSRGPVAKAIKGR